MIRLKQRVEKLRISYFVFYFLKEIKSVEISCSSVGSLFNKLHFVFHGSIYSRQYLFNLTTLKVLFNNSYLKIFLFSTGL